MRLVHLADLHLGFRQYQRLTSGGINQREADVAATFSRAVDQIIQLAPNVIVVGGDVFHSVRPSNPAIIHAFKQFSRLREELPETPIVMVAGNHDAPRTNDTGCILRLFRELNVHVADNKTELFTFADLSLAILAVPDVPGIDRPPLVPEPGYAHNVLLMHGEIAGVLPAHASSSDRATIEIPTADLNAERWSYIALGHYHVYRQVAPHAYYSGSLDYTSSNPWGELREEREARIDGKGFVEHNLATGQHQFHDVRPSRELLDLDPVDAKGLDAAALDEAILDRINNAQPTIDDRVVRLVVRNAARHVVRDLDHNKIREYKRRALHFHLDTRKPEVLAVRKGDGSPGRKVTLPELVADRLRMRVIPTNIERDTFVHSGLRYLAQAEEEATALPMAETTS